MHFVWVLTYWPLLLRNCALSTQPEDSPFPHLLHKKAAVEPYPHVRLIQHTLRKSDQVICCNADHSGARSKAWTVFARSNAGVVGSNPTQGICVCVRLFCVCVVLCVCSGLATAWSSVQGVLPIVNGLRNWKSAQGPTKSCRAINRQTDR
jgi:hypothetical protein